MKNCTFNFLLSWCFAGKTAFGDDFSLCLQCFPSSRLAISDIPGEKILRELSRNIYPFTYAAVLKHAHELVS